MKGIREKKAVRERESVQKKITKLHGEDTIESMVEQKCKACDYASVKLPAKCTKDLLPLTLDGSPCPYFSSR